MSLKQQVTPASNKQVRAIENLRDNYGLTVDVPADLTMARAGEILEGLFDLIADVPLEVFKAFQAGYSAMKSAEADELPPVNAFLVIYDAPRSFKLDSEMEKGLQVRNKHNRENDEFRSVSRPRIAPVLPDGTTQSQELAFWKAVKAHLSKFRWKTEDSEGNEGFSIRTA